MFSVDRAFVRRCQTPCLLLPGRAIPDPAITGAELNLLLPNVEQMFDWTGPHHLTEQQRHVLAFLAKHTP